MPEGHTIHALARRLDEAYDGSVVAASSPQGRFVEGAALIDGSVWLGSEAYGKHLLVDLDLPRGRLRLHDARDCPDGVRPFAPPYVMLPLRLSAGNQPLVPVTVNGVALRAVLDTGARATVLTEDAARRVGLGRPMREDVTRGVDGAATPVRWHRARDLRVGWDALADVAVSVAALNLGEADMLLGMDYLSRFTRVGFEEGMLVLER